MEAILGKIIGDFIPWIIPLILIGSFLVNHGYGSTGKKGGGGSNSGKKDSSKDDTPPVQDPPGDGT